MNSNCKQWVDKLGLATQITQSEATKLFHVNVRELNELGNNLSFWKMKSGRLLVVDEEFEFAYVQCNAQNEWNDFEWDMALAVTDRCEK